MHMQYANGIYVPKPKFLTIPRKPSIANLEPYLTINGTTVKADVRYNGKDAGASSWPPWGPGGSLTITSGTAPTLNNGSSLFSSCDDSVLFNNGAAYEDTGGTIGQITTEDIVVEAFVKTPASGTADGFIATTRTAAKGWLLFIDNTDTFGFLINDGSSAALYSAAWDPFTWYHVMCFINRDEASTNGSQIYVNGVASGSGVDCSSEATSLSAENFTIGRRSEASTGGLQSNVALFAMWKYANWFKSGSDGPAEWAEIAAQRHAELYSMYANGFGTKQPTNLERASTDYTVKWEPSLSKFKYYMIGDDAPAFGHRYDESGQLFWGYQPNDSCTNLITESEDLSTTWTGINLTSVSSNTADCPDGRTVADGIVGDASDAQHGVSITATLTAQNYVFYVLAKPGDQDWIKLEDSTIANCYAYFRIDDGNEQKGSTPGAGIIESFLWPDFWNGFTLCAIKFTGTAASHTFKMLSAIADNDDTFAGDTSTVNSIFWGATCARTDIPGPPINTSGGTAARAYSLLRYKADDGNVTDNQIGSHQCEFLFPDYDIKDPKPTIYLTKGGAVADRVYAYAQAAETYRCNSAATGGNLGVSAPAGDVADGTPHRCVQRWEVDNMDGFNGVTQSTPDTDCGMPDDLDRIDIGNNQTASINFTGVIQKPTVFDHRIDVNSGKVCVDARKRGVDQLNASLTINGTTKTPEYRYKGGDADGTDWNYWTYGGDLTLLTGTAPSYNQGHPDVGQIGKRWDLNTDSVKFNNGGAYGDTGGTIGQIGTEDFVFEIVFKYYQTDTDYLLCTRYDAAGYLIRIDNNDELMLYVHDGTTGIYTNTGTGVFTENDWYHVMIFGNRDENSADSCKIYVNGEVKGDGDNISTANGSLSGADFTIGRKSDPGTGNAAEATIVYAAMYKQASWHQAGSSGPAEWAPIAKARSDAFWGTV